MILLLKIFVTKTILKEHTPIELLTYWLKLNEKLLNFEIHFHRSGMKTQNFEMTNISSIILFITWSFSFLNAIPLSRVPGHYINRKMQYSTARTVVK